MKGNDEITAQAEITGLFRSRLSGVEMTVRDGFWEELQAGLPKAGTDRSTPAAVSGAIDSSFGTTDCLSETADSLSETADCLSGAADGLSGQRRKGILLVPRFHRVAAAASVIMVLGAASAAFWYFSPKEEIQEAFTKVATLTPEGNMNGDVVQENFPSIHNTVPAVPDPGQKHPGPASSAVAFAQDEEEDESLSVTVSITIRQHLYGNHPQRGNGMYGQNASSREGNGYYAAADTENTTGTTASNSCSSHAETTAVSGADAVGRRRNWAFKAGVGTSLPKSGFGMPLTANLSAERRLNRHFSLEAGLQYNRLEGEGERVLHTLAVPVKLNAMLASASKVDLYATLGGAVEKCLSGAEDNGFGAEPLQLSAMAGLGVRYKLNDRIALFAEPSVSHHFDTDSRTRTLRTERPTNLNLLCGVRMVY